MQPEHYARKPKCLHCGTRSMFVDWYRMRKERAAIACHCHGFLHRKGSRYCIHNSNLTDADHEERYGIHCPF